VTAVRLSVPPDPASVSGTQFGEAVTTPSARQYESTRPGVAHVATAVSLVELEPGAVVKVRKPMAAS
jgi:hypothetical protein